MMPAKMMRSAPPDFGDHGRTHRAHDTISSLGRPPLPLDRLPTGLRVHFFLLVQSWPRRFDGPVRTTLRCTYSLQCPEL